MVSRWLRGAIVVEAIVLLFAVASLFPGHLTLVTILGACAATVLLNLGVAAALYAVARL